jgi:hypothetical protein
VVQNGNRLGRAVDEVACEVREYELHYDIEHVFEQLRLDALFAFEEELHDILELSREILHVEFVEVCVAARLVLQRRQEPRELVLQVGQRDDYLVAMQFLQWEVVERVDPAKQDFQQLQDLNLHLMRGTLALRVDTLELTCVVFSEQLLHLQDRVPLRLECLYVLLVS